MAKKEQRKEIVEGVLIPDGWNKDYAVTSLFIACDGEREIAIGNLDDHPELVTMLRKRVRVTGLVARGKTRESIEVESVLSLNAETESGARRVKAKGK